MTSSELLDGAIAVMKGLSNEWEYSGPVSPETRLFADMDLKSLDFVILSTAMVRKYGKIPFDELYADLSERPAETKEMTVSEFVDFVYNHLPPAGSA